MTKHPANEYQHPQEDAEMGFNYWFYEEFYGPFSFRFEYFWEDIHIQDENQRKDILIDWLNSAFIAGYECAMYAKLEEEHHKNLDEVYDEIEKNIEETDELLKKVDEYLK